MWKPHKCTTHHMIRIKSWLKNPRVLKAQQAQEPAIVDTVVVPERTVEVTYTKEQLIGFVNGLNADIDRIKGILKEKEGERDRYQALIDNN